MQACDSLVVTIVSEKASSNRILVLQTELLPYLGSDEEVLSPDHAIVEEPLESNTNLV